MRVAAHTACTFFDISSTNGSQLCGKSTLFVSTGFGIYFFITFNLFILFYLYIVRCLDGCIYQRIYLFYLFTTYIKLVMSFLLDFAGFLKSIWSMSEMSRRMLLTICSLWLPSKLYIESMSCGNAARGSMLIG